MYHLTEGLCNSSVGRSAVWRKPHDIKAIESEIEIQNLQIRNFRALIHGF